MVNTNPDFSELRPVDSEGSVVGAVGKGDPRDADPMPNPIWDGSMSRNVMEYDDGQPRGLVFDHLPELEQQQERRQSMGPAITPELILAAVEDGLMENEIFAEMKAAEFRDAAKSITNNIMSSLTDGLEGE